MKWGRRFCGLLLTIGTGQALATNGYFTHGNGIKAQGQAGVAIAQPQDALAGANNPAGIAWIGDRLDLGATLFAPDRQSEISGNAAGADGHYNGNAKNVFLLPEFGVSKQLSDRLGVGLAVYGNGGMNTDYRKNPYGAFGSSGSAGVDLAQVFITPSIAYRFTERQSVGIGLNLVYQRFAAKGLSAFRAPGFSSDSDNLTDRGHDTSTGVGFRLGWQGEVFDGLTLGLTWSSKIEARKFDRYAGLFADGGSFDIPENYGIGLSYRATPRLTLGADVQEIKYGSVRSIANTFSLQSVFAGNALGSAQGPGFGWRDVTVYKFAASYALTPALTLRAGYSHADQPVARSQTFLNILAPGVIQDHASLGLTWATSAKSELSLAYTHGFEKKVDGKGSIPAAFGGGEADLKMKQDIVGLAYGWKF
ncbi:OmpP1/FadL family transporter [Pseudomonas oryzihabitans]|uniref:OmpP1/FadL family transporter n=1 Tax=Pseudomonas oryzihabitans TaxID=47885 RepID=UPI0011217AE1|nr:outer membrane protein transport protein [Pseudomonas psychrotolerans]QDD90825.1 long-chain fatty acid transporter [Pseudomonas psychrotolerans]